MSSHTDDSLITEALRRLDPEGAAELTDVERDRAEAAYARIIAAPSDAPAGVEPGRPKRRRRRLLAAVGVAGAAAVAVPVLLLGGGTAYGTWKATPTSLTGAAATDAAAACRLTLQTQPSGAPVDVPTLPGPGRVAVAERRGGWTYVLIDGPGRAQGMCLMPSDEIGKGRPPESSGGYYDPDAPPAPTLSRGRIVVTTSAEGSTEEGWFDWLEGYVGSDVTGVTVHTSSGLDIQASVVGNRFAAWWPGVVQSSHNPKGETWSYTVHLADGSSRNTDCSESTRPC